MSWMIRVLRSGATYDVPDWKPGGVNMGYDFSASPGVFNGEYAKNGVNAAYLTENSVLIALWNGLEYPDSRWEIQGGSGSSMDEEDAYFKVIGKSHKDAFRRAIVRNPGNPNLAWDFTPLVDPEHEEMGNVPTNPGAVLYNLISAAQARGALTGITVAFDTANDSDGQPWSDVLDDLKLPAGTPISQVLGNLYDQGSIEIEMQGAQLRVYNFGALGVDRSATVSINGGDDIEEAPFRWTNEDRAKYSLAIGDENSYVERTESGTPNGIFGREEQALTFGGTKSTSVLSLVNNASLARATGMRRELTRRIKVREGLIPMVNYRVGDWILERTASSPETLRIRAMVIEPAFDGTLGYVSLTLNDKLVENDIKMLKRLDGIVAPSAPGSGNGLTQVYVPDTTIPNPPSGVSAVAEPYVMNNGALRLPRVRLGVSWDRPSSNTNGSPFSDFGEYEIRYRTVGSSIWMSEQTRMDSYPIDGLLAGTSEEIQIRVFDLDGHASDWSTLFISDALPADDDPPPIPSALTAQVLYGSVTLTWDGLTEDAEEMPSDFSHSVLQISDDAEATWSNSVHLSGAGTTVLILEYGVEYHFRLVARDVWTNESDPSDSVSATPVRLIETDLDVVLPGQITYSDVNNLIPDGSFETPQVRDLRPLDYIDTDAFSGDWSLRLSADGTTWLRSQSYDPLVGPISIISTKLYISMQAKSIDSADGIIDVVINNLNDPGNVVIRSLDPADFSGQWVFTEMVADIPTGALFEIGLVLHDHTTGEWHVDTMFVREVVPSVLIQDAAITRAKIAEAAIGTAQVDKLEFSVLEGGLMDASMVVAGSVATGDIDEPRVEMVDSRISIWEDDGAGGLSEGTRLDPEGSVFRGNVVATNIDVLGKLKMMSNSNTIDQNGVLTLTGQIVAPTVAPTVVNFWNNVQMHDQNGAPLTGIMEATRDSSGNLWALKSTGSMSYRIYENDASGAYITHFSYTDTSEIQRVAGTGMAIANGRAWWIYWNDVLYPGHKSREMFLAGRKLTSPYDMRYWRLSDGFVDGLGEYHTWMVDHTYIDLEHGYTPFFFLSGNDIWFAFRDSTDNKETFAKYGTLPSDDSFSDITGLPLTTRKNSTALSGLNVPRGAAVGSFDIGSTHWLFGESGYYRFTRDSDVANQSIREFAAAAATISVGYYGGLFWSIDASGKMYIHDGTNWTDASYVKSYQFGYTYYDSNGTVHETTMSPRTAFSMKKRSRTRVTTSSWPAPTGADDVNSVRVYAAIGAGTAYLNGGASTNPTVYIQNVAVSGTAAPGSNSFPVSGAPGRINLGTTGYYLNGSASGGSLPAAIITSGTLAMARLPSLSTVNITDITTSGGVLRVGSYKIEFGTINLSTGGGTDAEDAVTFPSAFSSSPVINVSMQGSGFSPYISSKSSTGFIAGMRHIDAANTSVTRTLNWMAIGSA